MSTELQTPTPVKFPRDLSARLIRGELVLADLFGLDRRALYEIASIGYDLLNSGKLTEAKQVYEGLVAADPYDSVFHCHLGATLHQLGQLDEAFKQYDAALRLNWANVDALVGRGEIYLLRGELLQGFSDLKSAVTLDEAGARPASARARQLLVALQRDVTKK
jgi:Flp pilus assembly protein TadD